MKTNKMNRVSTKTLISIDNTQSDQGPELQCLLNVKEDLS